MIREHKVYGRISVESEVRQGHIPDGLVDHPSLIPMDDMLYVADTTKLFHRCRKAVASRSVTEMQEDLAKLCVGTQRSAVPNVTIAA